MFSLSQQKMMQAERRTMSAPAFTAPGKSGKWLTLAHSNSDAKGCSSSADGIHEVLRADGLQLDDLQADDLKLVINRLQDEIVSLTRKLDEANNDILWRDTLAARHAEAYALAEQQALQNASAM
jgi:hypothetical protein